MFQLPKSKHIPLPEFVIREQQDDDLFRQIDTMGLLPCTSSASLSSTSQIASSWDGPPGLHDLPHVLPTFPWEYKSLESPAHTPLSSQGHTELSNMLAVLSEYDSEGDDEITIFLSEFERS